MSFKKNKAEYACVNMRKYITSQVPLVWYNTFVYSYSQTEVKTL